MLLSGKEGHHFTHGEFSGLCKQEIIENLNDYDLKKIQILGGAREEHIKCNEQKKSRDLDKMRPYDAREPWVT